MMCNITVLVSDEWTFYFSHGKDGYPEGENLVRERERGYIIHCYIPPLMWPLRPPAPAPPFHDQTIWNKII